MTKYHISVKATFLEFVPLDATSESPLRRCRSCSPHWSPPEIEKGKRGGGASDSTAAETEDVVLNSSEDTEDCKGQPQVLYKKHRSNLYRKINKEISSAYCTQSLLNIIDRSLGDMNAVNLSTSIHRLARAIGSHEWDAEVSRVLDRLLDAIEDQAVSELERGASKFSPRCATIIAWSCATLQVFRLRLFSVLMTISLQSLQSCQAYEVTNLLWAVAQLSKQSPEPVLMHEVQELITASTSFFRDCDSLGQVKAQVLVSALVSVADLTVDGPSQAWLFQSLCEMLVPKCPELSFSSKTHIVMAFQAMHGRDSHFVERLIKSVSELCPELIGVSPLRTS